MIFFFFFKQKPADEVRISDWSSDVCSSDLLVEVHPDREARQVGVRRRRTKGPPDRDTERLGLTPVQRGEDGLAVVEVLVRERLRDAGLCREADRKRVEEGPRVSVRVASGGRRILNKKNLH